MPQIEASVGYGDLNFETERIDTGETLYGERKGGIYYGSVGFRQLNTAQEERVATVPMEGLTLDKSLSKVIQRPEVLLL